MSVETPATGILHFGIFDLDLRTGDLRRGGKPVRLAPQPLKILTLLAAQPGRLVTREEIQKIVWPGDSDVDADLGINSCIRQIREALGDSVESPRFIATQPRRGYAFIAPVEGPGVSARHDGSARSLKVVSVSQVRQAPDVRRRALFSVACMTTVVLALLLLWPRLTSRATPLSGRIVLAVLPFEHWSTDPAQQYFTDGLTEELITKLGRLDPARLGVIARTSAMRYHTNAAPGKSVSEIARELHADFVLEGSVRKAGNRLRVTAQLIDARNQSHLWAESYDRQLADAMQLQTELAQRIARTLSIELSPTQGSFLAAAGAGGAKPAAVDSYLQGRSQFHRMSGESFRSAVGHLEEAVRQDPNYAAAWSALADVYGMMPWWGAMPPGEAFPKAKTAAERAVALAPELAEAQNSLAFVRAYYDQDWPAAEVHFRRAIELAPGLALPHYWYAGFLSAMGRHGEALASIARAREIDPLSPLINVDVGYYSYLARRYDAAIAECRRTLELAPGFAFAQWCITASQIELGRWDEARISARRLLQMAGARAQGLATFDAAPDAKAALRFTAEWFQKRMDTAPPHIWISPYNRAISLVELGENEKALPELEKSVVIRDPSALLLAVDPRLDSLRATPRFQSLLSRLKLPAR